MVVVRHDTPNKDNEEEMPPVEKLARMQLNHAIAEIGPGPYQLYVLLLAGGVYTAEGSLLLMLSVIAKSLILRWKLSAMFAGAMVSMIFGGLLVGTILGGFYCDRYGRRMPILVTYLGMTVFLVACLMSPDILLLSINKLMLGVSLGFGVPAANAMVCESCPASHRSNVYSMTMVMFSFGQMYSACVLWVLSPEIDHSVLHWRLMLGLAALLPFVLGIVSYFFLLESPHWLLAQRRYSDAKDVIFQMATYKGNIPDEIMNDLTPDIQTPAQTPAQTPEISSKLPDEERSCCSADERSVVITQLETMWVGLRHDMGRLELLFSEKFKTTTILMSYISIVSNFTYYGMIYGLPETLKREQEGSAGSWSPAAGVFFSAVFEIPGVFVAIILGTTVGRRTHMTISFIATALSLAWVIWVMHTGRLENAGLMAVFCVKLNIASVFIIVYLYLLECYPTKFRATGLAFCMVIGRMGAFVCPFLFDGLTHAGFDHIWFYIVMCSMVVLAAIVSYLLPYETKDCQLMEDEAPKEMPSMHETEALNSSRRHGTRRHTSPSRSQSNPDFGSPAPTHYNTIEDLENKRPKRCNT